MCEACRFGKQAQLSFPREGNMSRRPLDIVHNDVWGPPPTPTLRGRNYYVTLFALDLPKKSTILNKE